IRCAPNRPWRCKKRSTRRSKPWLRRKVCCCFRLRCCARDCARYARRALRVPMWHARTLPGTLAMKGGRRQARRDVANKLNGLEFRKKAASAGKVGFVRRTMNAEQVSLLVGGFDQNAGKVE